MHPLLRIVGADPQLLVDHAEAYAALFTADVGRTASAWTLRAVWYAATALCGMVGVNMLGVAVMLWAVTPDGTQQAALVLLVVTLTPLTAALLCALATQRSRVTPSFDNLQQQLRADLQMMREVQA